MTVLTNAGLQYRAKLFNGVSTDPFKYIAIATGTTAEGYTLTALTSEITTNGGERMEGTGTYVADYIAQVQGTFSFTGDLAIRSAGLFDTAVTGGNMAIYHLWSAAKNVANGESMTLTFQITEGRA